MCEFGVSSCAGLWHSRYDGLGTVGLIIQSTHKNLKGDNVFFRFIEQKSEGTKR